MTSKTESRADRSPLWLRWAREIDALASSGTYYARNEYEKGRAERLQEIAAEIVAEYGDVDDGEILKALRAQTGYITPKVDVRGAVFDGPQILLVKESLDDTWTLPGGWADVGETPREAVEREVFEESGLVVRAQRPVGIYDANRVENALNLFHAYKLIFLCVAEGGELRTSHETSEVAYFPFGDLPDGLSTFRTTPRHLQDVIQAYRQPDRPVVFD